MAYRRILVTLDGSKLSELALQHAINIAEHNATIHILSVVAEGPASEAASLASAMAYPSPQTEGQWPPTKGISDPRDIGARQKYLKEVSQWIEPAGYDVTIEARPGEVIRTILEVANRGFDVIVMATHGRTGINRVVLGSVAEVLIVDAPCPVLVVTPNAKHPN